jgi:hypothetical protein
MKLSEMLSNQFIRITLMIFFFLFISKIVYAVGVFFGVEPMILSIYMCWITMIVLFGSLLPVKKTNFNVISS